MLIDIEFDIPINTSLSTRAANPLVVEQVPRNKWVCPACTSKSPRGRRGRAKKVSESNTQGAANNSTTPLDVSQDGIDEAQPSTPVSSSKKERANKKVRTKARQS